jgi:hypothetical protein
VTRKKEGNVYLPKRRSKKINVSKKKEGRICHKQQARKKMFIIKQKKEKDAPRRRRNE